MKTDYEKQANDFLSKTNTVITSQYIKNDFYFEGDKEKRDIYEITIQRENRKIVFTFANSIANSGFYIQFGVRKIIIPQEFIKYNDAQIKINSMNFTREVIEPIDKIHRPTTPTNYTILSCLQKYEVGTFADFCSEFGYSEDSRAAEKTYKAVCKEYDNVFKIWNDLEIEKLQEIQ